MPTVSLASLAIAPAAALALAAGAAPPSAGGGADEAPFLRRVDAFWEWFEENEERMHRNMFDARIVELGDALGARIRDVAPGVSWRFGPGDVPGEHAVVLSPEGDLDLRLLCEVWVERAPALEGWTFRPSEPPTDLDEAAFGVGDERVAPGDARMTLEVDESAERVDIALFHPAFADVPGRVRIALATELVRSALGEDRAMLWLGEVSALDAPPDPADAWTLRRLQTDLHAMAAERGWPDGFDLSDWRAYEVEPDPDGRFPRAALSGGRSAAPWFMRLHHERGGRPRDPLRRTGAAYVTVRFPLAALADGVAPDDLAGQLSPNLPAARVIGAATGPESTFVDILALDLERTAADLRHTLAALEISSEATLLRLAFGGPRPTELR